MSIENPPATVIVTGATGFVGRNLLQRLACQVDRVIAINRGDVLPTGPSGVALSRIEQVAVRDLGALDPGADAIVVHLAASRYDAVKFRTDQARILVENVDLAGWIYSFCAEKGINEVRLASSIAVYGASQIVLDDQQPLPENDPFVSEMMYGWSKRVAETYSRLFLEKYGIHTVAFRLSNPYGPFDAIDEESAHVVPAFVIRALCGDGPFTIRGNPAATRDFIFIDDVVDVLTRSLSWRERTGVFNLATGQNVTIQYLAETVLRLTRCNRPIVVGGAATGDVVHRQCAVEALRRAFHPGPMTQLEQGLIPTIEWYRNVLGR
ncbi:MAG: NAD(P)-dependent oxidoreductase [Acidobacteriaceae bacterium]|nr:NAD(P)-dependent oxidoreductase [Acidobacteriaceae bacterium]